jgi:hypothetical protein
VLKCDASATGAVTFCAVRDVWCHPAPLVPCINMPSPPLLSRGMLLCVCIL